MKGELQALTVLNRLSPGNRDISNLLIQNIPPSEILDRIREGQFRRKSESLSKILQTFNPEREVELCERHRIRCLTLLDPDYPELLKQISDPPFLLYMRGSFANSDQASLAVVGSRHPSFYGIKHAKQFSEELSRQGWTIVSGLARGIDHAAHEAALGVSYGRSIAVMGCGIDRVYPRESRHLYDQLIERGAIFSEYPLGTPPLAGHFPRRNRIISGLCLGVLVVEAHQRSGSLITAHEAIEQGREVFAIPGPIDQLTSHGTHRLLKEGAVLAENVRDILEGLNPNLRSLITPIADESRSLETEERIEKEPDEASGFASSLNEEEAQLVESLAGGPLTYGELASRSAFHPGRLAALVVGLELRQKVRKSPDGRFVKVS